MYGGDVKTINELAVSHYQGIKLWAEVVKRAGTLNHDKVVAAMAGVSIEGPSGKVTIDGQTHHVTLDVHVMEMLDQQLKELKSVPQRPPSDTQAVCNLYKNPNSSIQYELKI